ncbi:hypothetical protein RND71_005748 [Anisodus tanguticus]|uniref:Uncharacterized protein n=1 Tax=Anisodus tanguticus TaxID=243964 RepID=A0AAE1VSN1_9SOLA|nr:hypothetical protein RND71_005748 [Anisodus tanguticus]
MVAGGVVVLLVYNDGGLLVTTGGCDGRSVDYTSVPRRDGDGNCANGSFTSGFQSTMDLGSWQEVFEHCTRETPMQFHEQPVNQSWITDSSYDFGNNSLDENSLPSNLHNVRGPLYLSLDEQEEQLLQMNLQNLNSHLGSILKEEGLNKVDSFSHWAVKELEDVEELLVQPNNRISWSVIDNDGSCIPSELQLDSDTLNPSLSQVQLFSIIDFSPNCAYSASETKCEVFLFKAFTLLNELKDRLLIPNCSLCTTPNKVLITGKFLKTEREVAECKWSCLFGELEVVAEFGPSQGFDAADMLINEMHLLERFESSLSLSLADSHDSSENPMAANEKEGTINKIMCLLEEENQQMVERASAFDMSQPRVMEDLLLENQLKERFYAWLVHQVTGNGKRQTVLDDKGQGVLHVAAALGYGWALKPILASGIKQLTIELFLSYREKTVVNLVSLGSSPGALTDPSAEFPLGRTPADLASANGHKGISGFLAESSLTTHLRHLLCTFAQGFAGCVWNDTQATARIHQIFRVQSFQRKQIIEHSNNELSSDEHALSIQKKLLPCDLEVTGSSRGNSLLQKCKACMLGQNNGVDHATALHIQKKFHGWKKRKEFLLIRQRIVKIQALVRGHQVRKKYKPIIWSVGILEKVILRWRRKGSGLRGFRSEEVMNIRSSLDQPLLEDDYAFLKEGRKQTEVRMQKALARVKSMAQYPEARAQYRRLLTTAEGLREAKDKPYVRKEMERKCRAIFSWLLLLSAFTEGEPWSKWRGSSRENNLLQKCEPDGSTGIPKSSEDTSCHEENLFDVEDLLDDDTFMSIAFE